MKSCCRASPASSTLVLTSVPNAGLPPTESSQIAHTVNTHNTLTHAVLSLQQPLGLSVLTGRHVLVFNPALTAHNEIVRLCGSVIRAEPILSFSRARGWRDANCKAANLTSATLQPRKYAKSRLFDLNTPGVSRQGL